MRCLRLGSGCVAVLAATASAITFTGPEPGAWRRDARDIEAFSSNHGQGPAPALAQATVGDGGQVVSFGGVSDVAATARVSADASVTSHGGNTTKDVVYHLHIPKNAGISFGLDALDILSTNGLKLASREGCYHWQDQQPRVRGTAVLLRDPRKHVLSMYSFCGLSLLSSYRKTVRPAGSPDLPQTFEGWLEAWSQLQDAGWRGDFTPSAKLTSWSPIELAIRKFRMAAWSEPPFSPEHTQLNMKSWPELDGGGTIWHFSKAPFQCYSPLSFQTQRMSCTKAMEFPQEPDLEGALQSMNSTWFVGLVEEYQASLCLFQAKLTGRLPAYCDCQKPELWKSFEGHKDNMNTHHKPISEFPQRVIDLADKLTAADRALYHAARTRFVGEIREVEKAHGTKILCDEAGLLQG